MLAVLWALPVAGANPDLLTKPWSARWIVVPDSSPFDYGVYHFRKTFTLSDKPASFLIHVTGDNRYQLFVNGERVLAGPARGDLYHWRYESLDLAAWLKAGKNVLAAVVWNFGQYAPEAQITQQTGFLLQGDTAVERVVDTGTNWRARRDEAYTPIPITHGEMRGYFVAGPGERIAADRYPWGWEKTEFDDSRWKAASAMTNGSPRDSSDGPNRWMLVARNIPMMEERDEPEMKVRIREGGDSPVIPPHHLARIVLDQGYLTTAYPEVTLSGGEGATVTVRYAESLIEPGEYPGNMRKGNRNEVAGKTFIGNRDVLLPDGGSKRVFRTLWWRTWRYVEVLIQTADQPLELNSVRGKYTAYPFEAKAHLDSGSAELDKILEIGWRTARLCAHETYMDCPYYEQLQYVGDTRIQSLVSLYMTGDARLVKNAIQQISDSRTSEGATFSRAPTRQQQYIPGFSLWWIGMLHDYARYQDDPEFVRQMLPGVQSVLSFFAAHQQPGGSLGHMPWWNYVDWTEWKGGVPPSDASGSSAPQDLQLLLAYQWATDLGLPYRKQGDELKATVQRLYWDSVRRLYADTPERKAFSQHANVLAVLAGLIDGADAKDLMERVSTDKSLTQCSIYFRHYLNSALNRVGLGDRYIEMLQPWREMLALGLTTWAEKADPTRSDCHAWSASPNYELFHTVLGIDSAAPGFKRVLIRPFLGTLTSVGGSIPHPSGQIGVHFDVAKDGKLTADIDLPADTTGDLVWHGTSTPLKPGKQRLVL